MHALVLSLTVLTALTVAGCNGSASAPGPPVPPATRLAAPASVPGGVSLAALGFRYGPADRVWLPNTVIIRTRVDQENVVTVVLDEPAGDTVAAFLRAHLPAGGFTITTDANGALIFNDPDWAGSFMSNERLCALTLRKRAGT